MKKSVELCHNVRQVDVDAWSFCCVLWRCYQLVADKLNEE